MGRVGALVDIEREGPDWLEWAGALYESHAADWEALDGHVSDRYAKAAMNVAEELEEEYWENKHY